MPDSVKCPYCGSENVVISDADGHKKSEDPLAVAILGFGLFMMAFVCFSLYRLGLREIAVLLFVFSSIGFFAQYFVRRHLDKRMVGMCCCQDCHKFWMKQ